MQTDFLQAYVAKNWSSRTVTDLIAKVPTDTLEALQFFLETPNKRRKKGDDEYQNDSKLFHACAKTKDVSFIVNTFEGAIQTYQPELIVIALKRLTHNTNEARKVILEKVEDLVLVQSPNNNQIQKSIDVSRRICSYLGELVVEKYKKPWEYFTTILEENYLMIGQLNREVIFSAYSVSKKVVIEVDGIFDALEKMLVVKDPMSTWTKISDDLKKEHAFTFACLFMRAPFTLNPEHQKVVKDFTDKILPSLEKDIRQAIKMLFQAKLLISKATVNIP